jgi:hypothetical protein
VGYGAEKPVSGNRREKKRRISTKYGALKAGKASLGIQHGAKPQC